MAVINEITEVLHKIKAKLYPNYLGKGDGAYSLNSALTPGNMVHILGHKLKVEGEDPAVGVWFVNLAVNRSTELVGVISQWRDVSLSVDRSL
jgi:hypothetical protein